jgi:VWFA-related protein
VAQPLQLSVTTRLVQVSVVVQDGKGRPVDNLAKDDFTLLDNGKPQSINGFFRSAGERTLSAAPAAPAPPRDPAGQRTWSNREDATQARVRTVTAILVDGLNTNVKDQTFVKQNMLRFLRKLREGDSAAIYMLAEDLRIVHDFTTDSKALVAAFEQEDPKFLAQWRRESMVGGVHRAMLRTDRAQYTMSALRAIGEHLSRVPGRKNLVWVTRGFPTYVTEREKGRPGYFYDLMPEMQATARAIADADVALYPVSAIGLVGVPQISAAQGNTRTWTRGRQISTAGPEITNSRQTGPLHDMMIAIAEPTGGRAYFERNDLDSALGETIKDLTSSYTLTFRPSHDEWDGTYRQLKVQVNRKGLKVRHRPGYTAAAEGTVDQRDGETALADAIDNPLDSTGVGLTVSADAPRGESVTLRIRVDASTVTLSQDGERWKSTVVLAVVAEPAEGEAMARPEVQRAHLDMSREQYEGVMREGATITRTVPRAALARGVRIFVQDAASRRVGSVNVAEKL